jgi:Uma2 family endonuclease
MTTLALPVQRSPAKPSSPITAAPHPAPVQADCAVGRLRRFTVEEYERLIREGFFAHDEQFELLEGLIVKKMSRDPIHDAALEIADATIRLRVPAGWRIRLQSAISTWDSEPEPDLAVVKGSPLDHVGRHPSPNELALVIEVANSSLADDRLVKGRAYARAGIVSYWIINLIDTRVEVYSDPTGPDPSAAYRRRDDFPIGSSIPLTVGGTVVESVAVADLLPPALSTMAATQA